MDLKLLVVVQLLLPLKLFPLVTLLDLLRFLKPVREPLGRHVLLTLVDQPRDTLANFNTKMDACGEVPCYLDVEGFRVDLVHDVVLLAKLVDVPCQTFGFGSYDVRS